MVPPLDHPTLDDVLEKTSFNVDHDTSSSYKANTQDKGTGDTLGVQMNVDSKANYKSFVSVSTYHPESSLGYFGLWATFQDESSLLFTSIKVILNINYANDYPVSVECQWNGKICKVKKTYPASGDTTPFKTWPVLPMQWP